MATRDCPVEQFYRDNRLNQIHEGTHGIQGLDLLGRKVVMHEGAGLLLLVETMGATIDRARAVGGELGQLATALDALVQRLPRTTAALFAQGDIEVALANSTAYLEAVGHMVLAWIWLEQLLVAPSDGGNFYAGKWQAGRYFFRWELPKAGLQLDLLDSLDTTFVDTEPAWF